MLSAQTTDKQVNRTTPRLFSRVREPKDMLLLSLEEVTESIQSINYYKNKAKYLK
jgi:endonuclease-3